MGARTTYHKRMRQQRKQRAKASRQQRSGRLPGDFQGRLPRGKMSERIGHIAEPLIDECVETPDDMERIISLTVIAWNLTLLREPRRQEERVRVAKKLCGRRFFGIPLGVDESAVADFYKACDLVAERKEQFYPHVNDFILDVRFERVENSVYFEVTYALVAPNA